MTPAWGMATVAATCATGAAGALYAACEHGFTIHGASLLVATLTCSLMGVLAAIDAIDQFKNTGFF